MIGFDADDTLWHSEDGFRSNEERFVELIAPYAPEGIGVKAALTATERKNLATFVYGVNSFGLSIGRRPSRSPGRIRRLSSLNGGNGEGHSRNGAVARPCARGAGGGRASRA